MLLVCYGIIGGGLKYIDQAYDKLIFSKTKAKVLAGLLGLLGGYLIVTDAYNAMILFAVLVGNAILKKIDNTAFYIGVGILITVFIFFGNHISIQWPIFGLLILAAIADQYMDDWRERKAVSKLLDHILHYGYIWKASVLSLCLLGIMPWIYFFAVLVFDLAYSGVEIYSLKFVH